MLAKDTALYAIANGLNKGSILLVFPILLSFLTIEEYGIFTLVVAVSQFMIPFFCLSGTAGVVREGASNSSVALYLTYKFTLVVIANLIFLTIIYACFSNSIPHWLYLSVALGAINTIFELLMALFRAVCQKINYFYTSLFKALSVISAAMVGKAFSLNLIDLFYVIILFEMISASLILLKIYQNRYVFGYKKFSMNKVFSYSIFIIPHGLAIWAMSSSDRLIIKYFLGETQLGIYSLAYTIATFQALVNSGIGSALPQVIYKEFEKWENINLRVKVLLFFSLVSFCLLGLIKLAITIDQKFLLLLSHHNDIQYLLSILLPALYLMGLYQYYSIFLFYRRKTKNIFYISCAISIFNVFVNYLYVKVYGIYFAAFSTLATYFLFYSSIFFYVRRTDPCLKLAFVKEYISSIVILGIMLAHLIV